MNHLFAKSHNIWLICLDKKTADFYNRLVKAMTRTSNKEQTPTESSRSVRGAGSTFYEYISKLRTEMTKVGCDGFTRYREQMLMDV